MLNTFLKNITQNSLRILDTKISLSDYIPISLSDNNKDLVFDINSSDAWEKYIHKYLSEHNAEIAYGGYLEKRTIYQRSTYFNSTDDKNQRNIHLGIDFWCDKNTAVLAVLDGEVHSFRNNDNFGDYGPTIILKHSIENTIFYSLYGHLSMESIKDIKIGSRIKKEEIIGRLGGNEVNGDYAPHLHFQLIMDIQESIGDYPGVASENEIEYYSKNCPNPNLLLKLPDETSMLKTLSQSRMINKRTVSDRLKQ